MSNLRMSVYTDQENITNWRIGDVLQNRADGHEYMFLGSVDEKGSALYMIALNEKREVEYRYTIFALPTELWGGKKQVRGFKRVGR